MAESSYFEGTIFICIIANTLVLMLKYVDETQTSILVSAILNNLFSLIFICEAIIKIIALRSEYFMDNWNKFDFIIVCASLIGYILSNTTTLEVGGKATLVRAFRALRVFRLIKRAKVLKILIDTFVATLKSLLTVGFLLFIVLFIFSALGMELFARVKFGEFYNRHANFTSFGNAILLLLRASTGEAWDYILDDLESGGNIINNCS